MQYAQGGGSKKGGGNQKKAGSAIADLLKPKQPYEKTETIMHTLMLIENHRRKVGRCANLRGSMSNHFLALGVQEEGL